MRGRRFSFCIALLIAAEIAQGNGLPAPNDADYLWLEDSDAAATQAWVAGQNERTLNAFGETRLLQDLRHELFAVLSDPQRIPHVRKLGAHYYNVWRDAAHPRGLWRRTDWESYARSDPKWEIVLDVDALAARERESWVWRGVSCLHPAYRRCLVHLSRGGSDAVVIREFDTVRKEFVIDGFSLPEGKSRVAWRNVDHVYVATTIDPAFRTDAGYAKRVQVWRRGLPLAASPEVFAGESTDVAVSAFVSDAVDGRREFITRTISGNEGQTFMRQGEQWTRIDLPAGVEATAHNGRLLVWLRHAWRIGHIRHAPGSLLVIDLERFMSGRRDFQTLFAPEPGRTLHAYTGTRNRLLLTLLEGRGSRVISLRPRGGHWQTQILAHDPAGVMAVRPVDEFESDDYFLTTSGFLKPPSLYVGSVDRLGRVTHRLLWSMPAQFRADDLQVTRSTARSMDGTRVPYFRIAKKNLPFDGKRPTLLTAYGGFEVARVPHYDPVIGKAWLERGGVYVVANIRGGGEFGPEWHQAAIGRNRQNAYDDFLAVTNDLFERKITSPRHLVVRGISNGGLTVAAAVVQHPEMFAAAACHAPLLDMRRYHKLAAGASWLAEYGNPDLPEHWAFLGKYSPFQNIERERRYPALLLSASSRDDRVHPAHARKMIARMQDFGHEAWLVETPEGGHLGADFAGQAALEALTYSFLWRQAL